MTQICWGCHQIKEIAHTDVLARRFCAECLAIDTDAAQRAAAREFLAVTVPFATGDVVECRTAGERYDGTGTITTVSMDLKDGGTPVYPIFHVAFNVDQHRDATEGWYCEQDLTTAS